MSLESFLRIVAVQPHHADPGLDAQTVFVLPSRLPQSVAERPALFRPDGVALPARHVPLEADPDPSDPHLGSREGLVSSRRLEISARRARSVVRAVHGLRQVAVLQRRI